MISKGYLIQIQCTQCKIIYCELEDRVIKSIQQNGQAAMSKGGLYPTFSHLLQTDCFLYLKIYIHIRRLP
ncbi:hypothetical protein PPSC2_05520 [Paenibacillus polymyxa SC2]|uniref:Uncharacterized protein n=1 Tax=Paenibacillus polymyxa (strain SC2) TaxID=886882 RepID=A0A0D5ZC91_PAEPS|nr:hypothetical protein PPSC2_05520 [Paenibacillus polymyxa SC2]